MREVSEGGPANWAAAERRRKGEGQREREQRVVAQVGGGADAV